MNAQIVIIVKVDDIEQKWRTESYDLESDFPLEKLLQAGVIGIDSGITWLEKTYDVKRDMPK